MILDELVLHNVGTFAGRHSILLTPPSRDRPIILIGGLNGAGKTTLLEAIHLALYGSLAQISGRRSGSYENYLRGLIHHGVSHGDGAAIELSFHAYQEGVERSYWIRRSWRSSGASLREILLIKVDGQYDGALASTWNEHIENFLPRGIAGLFFFDGEQIEALADMERSRQVLGSALAALLGLDLVDRLATDLAVLRRRHRSQQVPESLRQAVENSRQAVTSIRREEEIGADVVASSRVEHERAEKRLFELTEQYRAAGGDLLDQRESAETTVTLVRAELAQIEEELRNEAADVAPLLQATDLLRGLEIQACAESTASRDRLVIAAVADRDSAVLEKLQAARVRSSTLIALERFLSDDRAARRASAEVLDVARLRDTAGLRFLNGSGLPSTARRLTRLRDRRLETRAKLDQAERVLVAIPDPESLASLKAERDVASDEAIRSQAALDHANERLKSLRHERSRADSTYEAALEKATYANLAADDDRRLVEHVDRVRTTLQALRSAAAKRHLDRISQLILEALTHLLRKENLVTGVRIDADTNSVELSGLDGRVLSAQDLSAGERQLLAVALLWGLARASGQPLPVVIDTPLGRLDGSHRENLLDRYFPHASHQVILLSTDTEIDELAHRRIARHVGRVFRLEFDRQSSATTVNPGYF